MAVATTIDEAMNDWRWLLPVDEIQILNTTCLGDVIFIDHEGAERILDVGAGQTRPYNLEERQLLAGQPELIARLEREGLKLREGHCFGLKPYSIFKPLIAENLYVAPLPEYVSFMGYVHGQLKDLPDGTKFRFKVVNEGPIQ